MAIDSRTPTSTSPSPDEQPAKPEAPAERPSFLRITASALAAMTTTALLSTLGVAGTIIGAALASVITVLANFVYTTSIHRTAEKVAATTPVHRARVRHETKTHAVGGRDGGATKHVPAVSAGASPAAFAEPRTEDRQDQGNDAGSDQEPPTVSTSGTGATAVPGTDPRRPGRVRSALRYVADRFGWRKILGVSAAFFLLIIGTITIIELATGQPISDTVRNREGSGTSVFGSSAPVTVPPAEQVGPGTGPGDVPPTDPEAPVTPAPTEAPTAPTDEVPPAEGPAPGPTAPPVEEPLPAPEPTTDVGSAPTPGPAPSPAPAPAPSPPSAPTEPVPAPTPAPTPPPVPAPGLSS